jgi:hypothetical protein
VKEDYTDNNLEHATDKYHRIEIDETNDEKFHDILNKTSLIPVFLPVNFPRFTAINIQLTHLIFFTVPHGTYNF